MISSPKIHTDLLWDLSLLFVALAVIYFAAVFFFRNTISSKSLKEKKSIKELSPMISEFLFHEDDATKEEKREYVHLKIEIRELLKNRFNRKVLSEILMDLRKDVSGETQKRLFKLYQDLGLHQDAYLKLRSWRWQIVSKGIYELTQMQIAESYGFITKFINDKRTTIRKQAEIATVTLKNEGIGYFLDTTKYRISEWQQLKLLDVIRNRDDFQPPRFKAWLTSNNNHVVLFAIRLIKYYTQNDANATLIELIKHKNNQIKAEAISCIKEFNMVEALGTLKLVYWKSTVDVKISILDAIAELGSEEDMDFLRSIERKETNFSVKSKAISSINSIVPDSILPTNGIQQFPGNQMPLHDFSTADQDNEEQLEEQRQGVEEDAPEVSREIKANETNDESNPETILAKNNFTSEETGLGKEIEKSNVDINDDTSSFIDIDFLPIVVAQKDTPISNTIIDDNISPELEDNNDLLGIEVSFEQIGQGSVFLDKELSKEETNEDNIADDDPNIVDLAFLPFVIDNTSKKENEYSHEQVSNSFNEDITLDDNEILEFDMTMDSKNFQDPDFTNNTSNVEKHNCKEPNGVSKSLINEVLDFDVFYEEIILKTSKKEAVDTHDEFIDWPADDFNVQKSNEFQSKLLNKEEEKAIDYMAKELKAILDKIPKPKYYDEETMTTIRLLDDIEELGDQREIPILEELLEKTETFDIKNRIEKIIKRFLVEKPQEQSIQVKESNSEEFKSFYIFEDLFRVSDTEGKLILMDEIVTVGDEKEIGFLNDLLEDSNILIREKAEIVLEALQNKLFRQNLCFEPSEHFIHDSKDDMVGNTFRNSFFDHMRSIPNKLIEILNG